MRATECVMFPGSGKFNWEMISLDRLQVSSTHETELLAVYHVWWWQHNNARLKWKCLAFKPKYIGCVLTWRGMGPVRSNCHSHATYKLIHLQLWTGIFGGNCSALQRPDYYTRSWLGFIERCRNSFKHITKYKDVNVINVFIRYRHNKSL